MSAVIFTNPLLAFDVPDITYYFVCCSYHVHSDGRYEREREAERSCAAGHLTFTSTRCNRIEGFDGIHQRALKSGVTMGMKLGMYSSLVCAISLTIVMIAPFLPT